MKLSPSLSAILAAVLTLVATSAATYFSGVHVYFASGAINWAGIGAYTLTTLVTIGAGVWTYIETHPAQVEQAGLDLLTQVHAPVARIEATVNRIDSTVQQLNTAPVTVNVHPAPVPIVPSSASQTSVTASDAVSPQRDVASQPTVSTPSVTLLNPTNIATAPTATPATITYPSSPTATYQANANGPTQLFSGDTSNGTIPRLQAVQG